MTLPQGPAGSLADNGKGFDQQIVQGLSPGEALAELSGLGLKLAIGQFHKSRLQVIDGLNQGF